jgi:DNA-binding NarL/FixJ family response regulator
VAEKRNVVRILVADDHALFRDGLRRLLETEPDFRLVGEARDGLETVKLAKKLGPDILLLDLAMPRVGGLEALRELAEAPSPVRTLLLTGAIETRQIVEAIQLGARGVVLKESAAELLFKSIRAVMAGQYWLGREAVSDLFEALRTLSPRRRRRSPPGTFGLTPRELEIVSAVVAGLPNRDIAQKFSLSEQTVKHHLTRIFDKVGVSSRLELAVFALHHGLGTSG